MRFFKLIIWLYVLSTAHLFAGHYELDGEFAGYEIDPLLDDFVPASFQKPGLESGVSQNQWDRQVEEFIFEGGTFPKDANGLFFEQKILLGEGSFGKVFKVGCIRDDLPTWLAVKRIELNDFKKISFAVNEVGILSLVSHPFIPRFDSYYLHGSHLHLAMDFCEGKELYELINKPFSEGKARGIVFKIASVLSYLHDKNIVFRDLKPENILVDDQDQIKLIDFGLARFSRQTIHGLAGTPEYLAPETLENSVQDFAGDCWALGIIWTELFRIGPPWFYDDSVIDTPFIKQKTRGFNFEEHIKSVETISQEAKNLLIRLLKKNPIKRLTMKGLLADPYFFGLSQTHETEEVEEEGVLRKKSRTLDD